MNNPLPGVLVTRPTHQAQQLSEKIHELGGHPVSFPTIQITPIEPDIQKYDFDQYSIIIFVSANAVNYGLQYLRTYLNPDRVKIFAIGKRTAQCLNEAGYLDIILPGSGFNSEALLTLDHLQANRVHNQHILIIRGQGGRDLLADCLTERGAIVGYLDVYQRTIPDIDTAPLLQLWSTDKVNIVIVTSNEILKNLYHMLEPDGLDYLLDTPLITPGQRCTKLAHELGFRNTILQAHSAMDSDIITQLKLWMVTKP
ncbi:MAG: uroporphyrinogen-III synthase [Gammaproteobacteria bacterium]|nr:uroporphyrinogen-III synthase [Gammaproteobacteria bacterium]